MKCEFLEGLSSVIVSMVFCIVLILPATIVGCANDNGANPPAGNMPAATDTNAENPDVDVDVGAGDTAADPVVP